MYLNRSIIFLHLSWLKRRTFFNHYISSTFSKNYYVEVYLSFIFNLFYSLFILVEGVIIILEELRPCKRSLLLNHILRDTCNLT